MSEAAPPSPSVPSPAPATSANSYSAAAQTIRATVRWLLTTAAGVAGVLVAGLQLTSLGSLKLDDPRLWVAIGGLIAAMAGIGCIILVTSKNLTDDWITLAQLSLDEFQAQLEQTTSTAGLMEDIEVYKHELYAHVADSIPDLYKRLIDTNEAARQPKPSQAEPKKKRWGKESSEAQTPSGPTAAQLREAAVAVVQYANYYSARNRLRNLPRQLLPAAIAVIAGVLIFAYTANPPKKDPPAPTINLVVTPSPPSPTTMPPSPQPSIRR